jgi:lysozyme
MSTETILRLEEGKRLDLYLDSEGIWTVGIGYNIQTRGLPDDIVEELFRRDMAALKADAARIPEYAALDAVRRGVIERMVFQMGVDGVMAFVNTRKAIREFRWIDAYNGIMSSKWAKQTPARAAREAQRILTGVE